MPSRSSIFSFDTLRGTVPPTKAFVLACAILVCIRIGMLPAKLLLERIPPESKLTDTLSFLSARYDETPEVVFFGSSRFISCIKSDVFAEKWGLEKKSVANLAMESGGPWEILTVCRLFPEILERASLAVIEVEPWMFNQNMGGAGSEQTPGASLDQYRWATFSERALFPQEQGRTALMLKELWPYYEKRALRDWVDGARRIATATAPDVLAPPKYHYDEADEKRLANRSQYAARPIAQRHVHDFEISKLQSESLQALLTFLRTKGVHVVLVQPPAREAYIETIKADPSVYEVYKDYLSLIRTVGDAGLGVYIWEKAAECGLDESVFVDYGHFNVGGAHAFSKMLCAQIGQTPGFPFGDSLR